MTEKKETSASFDLAEMDSIALSDNGADIELLNIKGEGTGIFFRILGKDSTAFRDAKKEEADRKFKMNSVNAQRGKFQAPITSQQLEDRATELLCVCTIGWKSGIEKDKLGNWIKFEDTITLKGEKLPFSIGKAKFIYENYPRIREQIDNAIDDLTNFI